LGLGEIGQADGRGTEAAGQTVLVDRGGIGQIDADAAGMAHLEDQRLFDHQAAIAGQGPGQRNRIGHYRISPSDAASASISDSVLVSVAASSSTGASSG